MFNRDPIRSLTLALHSALDRDLKAVESTLAYDVHGQHSSAGRRPREEECDVVLFGQIWSGQALGLQGPGAARPLERDTTVVVGPEQDACVYVSTELVYHINHPNRRFFLDVAAHSMVPKADAPLYEGRDDPVTEAVDIEVSSMLARLHAQVKASEPHRAPLVASYLHRCAARFEARAARPRATTAS